MGESALLVFSFFMQASIGIMFFMTLGKILHADQEFKKAAYLAAGLSIIGVIASLAHLGKPLAALNSLLNVGSSWLSREVLFSGVFMGIAVLYALVQYLKVENQGIKAALRWAGSGIGLIAVFSMAKLYSTASVPVWQGANTFADFYGTTIAVGALLFLALSFKELQGKDKKILGLIVLAAVVIQAAVAVPYGINLGLGGSAAHASAEILNGLSAAVGLKWLLVLGGAGILLWPTLQQEAKSATGMIYLAGIALVCGQFIGRYIFYAAMVVTNIGLI
ncbi:hypothetical protein HMPREF0322_00188 [Desulfitobacterium hafniense DP7]|uniref:DMSO reductase, anchor subunit DmsC n=1 Tax=Desulfitobacterium hafniense DP7 TaxID=537010 RepID=G9XGX2_DESHA|nr:DmsC/YnfH family molybdoenzyme membrane anchor subunit [Desulfitobacterium hafniense]EHL09157.1 hypothetical protein HMPREF0322_00188 [Desulfitobacterium hafniense DP7]